MKSFLDVNVGDVVICYDEYSHDYVEHEMKVTSIEYDKLNATETNPKGCRLYGEDISDDDDESMICMVYEGNFIRCNEEKSK